MASREGVSLQALNWQLYHRNDEPNDANAEDDNNDDHMVPNQEEPANNDDQDLFA